MNAIAFIDFFITACKITVEPIECAEVYSWIQVILLFPVTLWLHVYGADISTLNFLSVLRTPFRDWVNDFLFPKMIDRADNIMTNMAGPTKYCWWDYNYTANRSLSQTMFQCVPHGWGQMLTQWFLYLMSLQFMLGYPQVIQCPYSCGQMIFSPFSVLNRQ